MTVLRVRRLVPAMLAISVLLVLAGCGNSGSSAQTTAEDNQFLGQVHDADPNVNQYRSDTQLIRLGHAACDAFKSGVNYQEVADRLPLTEGSHPLPTGDLGTVITAAVSAYCPQYTNQVS